MTAVVAVCENGGIGKDGTLLFHIREDLRRFRQLTLGKTVVMGRKTLESLPGGRGLPDRRNLVLTRDPGLSAPGAEVLRRLEDVPEDAVVIGGDSVFRQMFPHLTRVYVTKIDSAPHSDVFFPDLDADPAWCCVSSEPRAEHDGVGYQFCVYEKVKE